MRIHLKRKTKEKRKTDDAIPQRRKKVRKKSNNAMPHTSIRDRKKDNNAIPQRCIRERRKGENAMPEGRIREKEKRRRRRRGVAPANGAKADPASKERRRDPGRKRGGSSTPIRSLEAGGWGEGSRGSVHAGWNHLGGQRSKLTITCASPACGKNTNLLEWLSHADGPTAGRGDVCY